MMVRFCLLGRCIVSFLLIFIGLVACERSDGSEDSVLSRIKAEDGVLRVGYSENPPFSYTDRNLDGFSGEAAEIAKIVLSRMGISQSKAVLIDSRKLVSALQNGEVDMIAGGIPIAPALCGSLAFSDPTFCVQLGFAIKSTDSAHLKSFSDLAKHRDLKIGTKQNSVFEQIVRNLGIRSNRILLYGSSKDGLAALRDGRIGAFAAENPVILDMFARASWVKPISESAPRKVGSLSGRVCGGFAFRREDRVFRESFNEHLSDFIGTAEHLRLVLRFGITRDDVLPDVKANQLCRVQDGES